MALTGADASEEVQVAVGGDASGFNSALDGALSKLGDFDTKLGVAGGAVAAFGGVIAADAVGAAADFDAAMTESLAIMDDVTEAMEEDMAEAAREVATETTFSAEQAAESYFFLASAGMDAAEAVDALPKVAEFAQAGMFDMAEATDILTDAQSALGEENIELAELGDILVAANQEANASVEEFGTALTNKAAPAMERLGVETEEGVGALAAFADQGLKGERAGTILARTLEGLETQARANEEEFEELGVSVFDAEGEMRDLQDIIVDLEDGLDGMSTKQRQAALDQLGFNDRASQGLDLLVGNSEQLGEYGEALADSGGAAEDVAEKQLDTLSARWELLRSQIDDLRIALGKQFLPALEGIVDGIAGAIEAFGAFNDMTDGAAAKVGLLAPTIAGALVALAVFGPALAGVALAAAPLIAAFLALSAVVAAAFLAWEENLFGIRDITRDVFEMISDVAEDVLEFVWQDIVEPTLTLIQEFWGEHGETIIETTTKTFETILETVKTVVTFLWEELLQPILATIGEAWDEHGESIIESATEAWDNISDKIETVVMFLWKDIVEPTLTLIQEFWDDHGETIIAAVERAFGIIVELVETSTTLIFETIDLFLSILAGDWEGAWESVENIVDTALGAIEDLIKGAVDIIGDAVDLVIDAILSPFEWLWDQLVGNSLIPEMLDQIEEIILGAPDAIRDAAGKVADAILGPISDLDPAGIATGFVDGVVSGLQSGVSKVADAADSLADAASSVWPGSDAERGPLSNFTDQVEALGQMPVEGLEAAKSDMERASHELAALATVGQQRPSQSIRRTNNDINIVVHARDGTDAGRRIERVLRREGALR